MTEILITLHKYLWIADFFTFCIFAFLALKNKQISSSFMALIITVLVAGTVAQYEILVKGFVSPDKNHAAFLFWSIGFVIVDIVAAFILYRGYQTTRPKRNKVGKWLYIGFATIFLISALFIQFGPLFFGIVGPSFKDWVRVAYYLGSAMLDGLAIYAIYQSHLVLKLQYSTIARMYLLAFFVVACLQIVRFIERYIWDTNNLQPIYQWGLVSINVTTTAVALLLACLAIYQFISKTSKQGALWNI